MYARRSVGVCSGRMAFSLPTNIHISISISVDDTTLRGVCNFVFLDGEQRRWNMSMSGCLWSGRKRDYMKGHSLQGLCFVQPRLSMVRIKSP